MFIFIEVEAAGAGFEIALFQKIIILRMSKVSEILMF
jgi:hypothetical protein